MQRRPYTSNLKEPTLICNNPKCDNISSKLCIVEEKIVGALKILLKNYYFDSKIENINDKNGIKVDKYLLIQFEKKLNKEKEKQKKIYSFFEENVYNKDEFRNRLSNSKSIIKELEEKVQLLRENLKGKENIQFQDKEMVCKLENIMDIYYKLETAKAKNEFLKAILKKVTYLKTVKSLKNTSNPANFELQIYPKIHRFF